MKKKQLRLGKLSFNKSVVAGFKANQLNGGTGTSWDGCPTLPGEPCTFPTDFDCGTNNCETNNCGTGDCGTNACATNNCDTLYCPTNGALNSCPPPGQYCL